MKNGLTVPQSVKGATYEEMLNSFDTMIRQEVFEYAQIFQDGIVDEVHIKWYQDVLQHPRLWSRFALKRISQALKSAYKQSVVVLLDEYDAPMHDAIENGYADLVRFSVFDGTHLLILIQAGSFFATVFGELLKVCRNLDPVNYTE